jgi:hypothetical protein
MTLGSLSMRDVIAAGLSNASGADVAILAGSGGTIGSLSARSTTGVAMTDALSLSAATGSGKSSGITLSGSFSIFDNSSFLMDATNGSVRNSLSLSLAVGNRQILVGDIALSNLSGQSGGASIAAMNYAGLQVADINVSASGGSAGSIAVANRQWCLLCRRQHRRPIRWNGQRP